MHPELSPAYTVDEVITNFEAMLEHMDFEQELTLLGLGRMRFLLRDKVKAEWQALVISLWRLALERSFPHDGDVIFATFMAQHTQAMRSKKAEAFAARVAEYVSDMLTRGDADFIPASERLLALLKAPPEAVPALQLKIALRIRALYTLIFKRLI